MTNQTSSQTLLPPASAEVVESIAFACICGITATKRLLVEKGVITSDEFAAEISAYAEMISNGVLRGRDLFEFNAAVDLLKGLAK